MRIGIDIRALLDPLHSGVPEFTLNLLRELFVQDRENEYVLFYNSGKDMSGKVPRFSAPNAGVKSTRWPNKIFNNIGQRLVRYPKLDRLTGTGLFYMPNIGFAALSASAKKVITVHDLSFLRYPEFYSLKRRAWHWAINARRMLRRFDCLAAVSQSTRDDILELIDIPEERVRLIHSGISPEFRLLDPGGKEAKKELRRVRNKYRLPDRFILFLGTLEPRKNIEGLIRAFDRLSRDFAQYDLVIAGGAGWKYKDIISARESAREKKRIRLIGYVDSRDKVYLYNLAALFAYPSFYEGFGFPPLEAMASGCPVIAGANSSMIEALGGAAELVDVNDVDSIQKGIEDLLADEQRQSELAKSGIEHAARFTWAKTAQEYRRLWRDLD